MDGQIPSSAVRPVGGGPEPRHDATNAPAGSRSRAGALLPSHGDPLMKEAKSHRATSSALSVASNINLIAEQSLRCDPCGGPLVKGTSNDLWERPRRRGATTPEAPPPVPEPRRTRGRKLCPLTGGMVPPDTEPRRKRGRGRGPEDRAHDQPLSDVVETGSASINTNSAAKQKERNTYRMESHPTTHLRASRRTGGFARAVISPARTIQRGWTHERPRLGHEHHCVCARLPVSSLCHLARQTRSAIHRQPRGHLEPATLPPIASLHKGRSRAPRCMERAVPSGRSDGGRPRNLAMGGGVGIPRQRVVPVEP